MWVPQARLSFANLDLDQSSAKWGVAVASHRVGEPIRLRSVPSSHENDRLSWPDRQTVRRTGDDTELEHNRCDRADFERPGEERDPCRPRRLTVENLRWASPFAVIRLPTGGRRCNQPPELTISDHRHDVSPRRQTPDLHELQATNLPGNLQRIGSAADQDIPRATGFRLHDGARPFRGDDRFAPRPAQKTRGRQGFSRDSSPAAS